MGGVWEAKKIANPENEDDDNLYAFEDFGFIGFDLWQVKGGTIFDNIIITDDRAEADKMAANWKKLSEVEKAKKKEEDDARLKKRKPRRKTVQMAAMMMMMMMTMTISKMRKRMKPEGINSKVCAPQSLPPWPGCEIRIE